MSDGSAPKLNSCGCCQGEPEFNTIDNRPGLSALSYRIGTYGLFFQRLLDQIHSYAIPDGPNQNSHPLAALTTRSRNDPAVALLDAWAVIADVLTFYQERIANEGYLRTATERRSILELAREIGYELSPGVAASAYLQFAVEEIIGTAPPAVKIPGIRTQPPAGPGSSVFNSGIVTVPQGTQVQSVPAPGQVPKTFETSANLQARVEWNTLRPRLSRPQDLALVRGNLTAPPKLYLLGASSSFPPGVAEKLSALDIYMLNPLTAQPSATGVPVNFIYLQGTSTSVKSGDRLLLVGVQNGATQSQAFVVRNVVADPSTNSTLVEFADNPSVPSFVPGTFPSTDLKVQNIPFNQDSVRTFILSKTISEGNLQAFLQMNRWNAEDLATLVNHPPPPPPAEEGVYSFGATAAFFGHNAPLYKSLPNTTFSRGDPYLDDWDAPKPKDDKGPIPPPRSIWTDSQGTPYTDANVFLERSFPKILAKSWAWLECTDVTSAYQVTGVTEKSLADYGLSGKSTGLKLKPFTDPGSSPEFRVRKTTAWLQSQQLALAKMPVVDDILVRSTELMLDDMVLGLTPGQVVALSGTQSNPPGVTANEILFLKSITHKAGFTVLEFTTGLKNNYIRSSVTINANVALATHGATVKEVLGSGDGSQTNQSFILKRPPLTYVSAPTPSGLASTLEIRVNGLAWQESSTLYGLTASDQEYVVRLADDGTPTVTFGDPAARLKTGQQNVTATYRTGIGLSGNVDAGSLSLLQSRPPGLRGVTNPLPASGAADPQNLAGARTNAPLTVLTLDRIVSLDDYQSFTQAFAGIGKAQAIAVWSGENHVIQITVAAASGATIGPTDALYQTLVNAIRLAHDPVQKFLVAGFQPLTFNLTAGILIDQPKYEPSVVMANAIVALTTAFSFANRAFAQAVSAAEILKLVQAVPGVIAVDLTQLYRTGDPSGPSQPEPLPFLPVLPARWDNLAGAIQPAQLLLLNPLGVTLTEMTS